MLRCLKFLSILLSILVFGACSAVSELPIVRATVHHKERVESRSMQDVVERVESLRRRFGPERVWVVFDIDNTVLTMNQLIGSDPWFSWQYQLLNRKSAAMAKPVARDLDHLLAIQRSLYSVSEMRLTEESLPELVRELQKEGHPVMALTSRNANMVEFTLRELTRYRISFAATSPKVSAVMQSGRLPKDKEEWLAAGFSEAEIEDLDLLKLNRAVSYKNGVFHASGQHKGALLRAIVEANGEVPKAIVFVDDQSRHVDRVIKAFAPLDMSVYAFRYGAIDTEVSTFEKGRGKIMANREWGILRRACSHPDGSRFSSMIRAVFDRLPPASNPRSLCKSAF